MREGVIVVEVDWQRGPGPAWTRFVGLLLAALTGLCGASASAVEIANSQSDWNPGVQNANHWAYGWRYLEEDPGAYSASHFRLFLNDASGGVTPVSQAGPNQWDGTAWDFGAVPWTHLGQLDCHPNGFNNTGGEQWVIRRWSSETSQPLEITWQISDNNVLGTGVTARLFLEGSELASLSTDGPTKTLTYYLNYVANDRIDFAITPVGVDGNPDDSGDLCSTTIVVDTDIPVDAMNPIGVRADSVADFSEFQGQDGWYYGYYDQRLDVESGNLTYDMADFVPFLNNGSTGIANDPTIGAWKSYPNHWSGSLWDLFDQSAYFQGPWTFMSDQMAEPAANGQVDPSVHWAVRRWVSDFAGTAVITGTLENASVGGDGVRGRFFTNGFEYYSQFSDGTNVPFEVEIPVVIGSVLDFALDSDGSFALNLLDPTTLDDLSDSADQSIFEVQIEGFVSFAPEPSMMLQLLAGVVVLEGLDRRRRRLGTSP